jgi:hypothetical protein
MEKPEIILFGVLAGLLIIVTLILLSDYRIQQIASSKDIIVRSGPDQAFGEDRAQSSATCQVVYGKEEPEKEVPETDSEKIEEGLEGFASLEEFSGEEGGYGPEFGAIMDGIVTDSEQTKAAMDDTTDTTSLPVDLNSDAFVRKIKMTEFATPDDPDVANIFNSIGSSLGDEELIVANNPYESAEISMAKKYHGSANHILRGAPKFQFKPEYAQYMCGAPISQSEVDSLYKYAPTVEMGL